MSVPPSGDVKIRSGRQSVSGHKSLAGRTVTVWADLRSIHLSLRRRRAAHSAIAFGARGPDPLGDARRTTGRPRTRPARATPRQRHVREPARGRGGDRYDRHQGRCGLHRRLQPSDRVRLGEAARSPCDSTGTQASRQDALRFGECSELERESAGGTVSASASTKNVSIGLGDPPPRLVPSPFWCLTRKNMRPAVAQACRGWVGRSV